ATGARGARAAGGRAVGVRLVTSLTPSVLRLLFRERRRRGEWDVRVEDVADDLPGPVGLLLPDLDVLPGVGSLGLTWYHQDPRILPIHIGEVPATVDVDLAEREVPVRRDRGCPCDERAMPADRRAVRRPELRVAGVEVGPRAPRRVPYGLLKVGA